MILEDLDIDSIKNGYMRDNETGGYVCLECGLRFEPGEIYDIGGRLYEYGRAAAAHVGAAHAERLAVLLHGQNKYITLTENQKELLELMNSGMADNAIADKLGVSSSTIRHQRFMFREKAKQARMYLAVYELAMGKNRVKGEEILPVHSAARMVDERFAITLDEKEKTIKAHIESIEPFRLKSFPVREKKKIIVLSLIAEQFERGRKYTEREVNGILKAIYPDNATLRRYLIEYGFMDRTRDCSEYWVK